jgi:nucleoid-associated protein YgaU
MAKVARKLIVCALLAAALGAVPVRSQGVPSQDVAEAARQERERKAKQAETPRHVYTDDDLKRTKILTPEDDNRVVSRKTNLVAPQKQEQQPLQVAEKPQDNSSPGQATLSLGEVARRYREEKATRQAELTARNKEQKSRYPLEIANPSLAKPKPIVKANVGSLREDELYPAKRSASVIPPVVRPAAGAHSRISPFAPRNPLAPLKSQPNLPVARVASSAGKKQVRRGDSWWRLAQRYLGEGSHWQEIWRANPGLGHDPNWLAAGTMVFVPAGSSRRSSPPGTQITVRPGDTLWSLAREHLGCAVSWPALAAANPEVTNYTKLQIGTRLRLPTGPQSACAPSTHLAARN